MRTNLASVYNNIYKVGININSKYLLINLIENKIVRYKNLKGLK